MSATVHDVAAAVLVNTGAISTMKLQKLVYILPGLDCGHRRPQRRLRPGDSGMG
jgi:hypothetical protein